MYTCATQSLKPLAATLVLIIMLAACGEDSQPDAQCQAVDNQDGTYSLQCPGQDAITWRDGEQGPAGENGQDGQDGMNGEQGVAGSQGEAGEQGVAGDDGYNVAVRVADATPDQCAQGGQVVYTGLDVDSSGELETGEETQNFIVCHGADGTSSSDGSQSLVAVTEAAPDECPQGGQRLDVGVDTSANGSLEPTEISQTFTLCNGATGAQGSASLIEVTTGGAQACAGVGNRVEVGVDLNHDGALTPEEVSGSFDVCNGVDGMDGVDGKNSLINVSAEPIGLNCSEPGLKVEVGLDVNGNGVLEDAEVDGSQTSYICESVMLPTPKLAPVSSRGFHACAIHSTGDLRCWGTNASGQLGDNTTQERSQPVSVVNLGSTVTSVAAGTFHTCALLDTGVVQCWGDNAFGQLGNGTTSSTSTASTTSNLTGVIALTTGSSHSCAITDTRDLYCWGWNISGQIGNGTTANTTQPVLVQGLSARPVELALGGSHTCAVLETGEVQCWGSNNYGQLGNGTTTNTTQPVTVTGLSSSVVSISAGNSNTCALLDTGEIQCWGWNSGGQLGNGTTTDSTQPVTVTGLGVAATAISSGDSHTCATTITNTMKCWGNNFFGQLGDGTTTDRTQPTNTTGLGSGVTHIAASNLYTCARLDTGKVQCWGLNNGGSLGNGTQNNSTQPVDVIGF